MIREKAETIEELSNAVLKVLTVEYNAARKLRLELQEKRASQLLQV